MASVRIEGLYFDWILDQVTMPDIHENYRELFKILHETEFTWLVEHDENRAADGVELRGKFAEEYGYSYYIWHEQIDNRPCTMLEMMAALAMRCEDCIMGDDEFGDRTHIWFWNMIYTMGLESESDDEINVDYVVNRVQKVLKREYSDDGYGGLFYVENNYNMVNLEIWYQLNTWLNEKYN